MELEEQGRIAEQPAIPPNLQPQPQAVKLGLDEITQDDPKERKQERAKEQVAQRGEQREEQRQERMSGGGGPQPGPSAGQNTGAGGVASDMTGTDGNNSLAGLMGQSP